MSATPQDRSAIDQPLETVQASLDRVQPAGATVVDRNLLEWRLDPASLHRLPEANDPDRWIILMCDAGYSSSLAAVVLRTLGLHRASDLVGGFQALSAHDAEDRR